MDLLPGVRSVQVDTERLRVHLLESGPADGVPLVLLHGNLSTGRFYEHLMPRIPDTYRVLAPDMRGFGDTEPLPLDATRGLTDWADDLAALLDALGIDRPPHLVGWSTGAAAITAFVRTRPAASLTFLDPVSPYGYGGVRRDGTPNADDHAGSGAGSVNPQLVASLARHDDDPGNPFSIRNVMRSLFFAPGFTLPAEREDVLVAEIHKTLLGDDGYPGDAATSPHWPGVAPGVRGIANALSPKYCRWDDIVDLDPKPPVLWTHGALDLVVSDASPLDFGVLGAQGLVPGWPGAHEFPVQPQVTQIRDVLQRYAAAGGSVRSEMFEGSAHGPCIDAEDRWLAVLLAFLADVRAVDTVS
ncbi:alpha/beta fold hydrolase [Nakamurella deserti]|uniref:alpha/beta fold hydrolase n=1 Tax=Nakamurella deserti TaxID=2164074 RepID=UPI000DBE48A1|nr:alpha/beta hydrolase [Nakamurella deserti]